MHILVLQHESVEHPGIFRQFLREDGHTYDAVELQLGERLPESMAEYDALWVMGGPMDTWQEDAHPWLVAEKAFIRRAVKDEAKPFLGLCLGHQLLACALGAEVGPGTPEIALMEVAITEPEPRKVFAGLPDAVEVLNWHGAEVKNLPEGAVTLASSPECKVQAMRYGRHAISAQFHLEIEPETVATWAMIPAYASALERALGSDGVDKLDQEVSARMAALNATARMFYDNWMALCVPQNSDA